nr:MAG: hypothetical protein DIU59_08125 [Pseudomonadota bacterium]
MSGKPDGTVEADAFGDVTVASSRRRRSPTKTWPVMRPRAPGVVISTVPMSAMPSLIVSCPVMLSKGVRPPRQSSAAARGRASTRRASSGRFTPAIEPAEISNWHCPRRACASSAKEAPAASN